MLVGAGIHPPRFDPNRILLNELEIKGSFVYDKDGFDRALELLTRPDFPTARSWSATMSISTGSTAPGRPGRG